MIKHFSYTTISLTRELAESIFDKQTDRLICLLHPDVIWIDGDKGCICQGVQEVLLHLTALFHLYCFSPDSQQYWMASQDAHTCAVAGWCASHTEKMEIGGMAVTLNITSIWRAVGATWKAIYVHISCPLCLPLQKRQLCFRGRNAETYFFHPEDILYAEASNIYSIIHTTNCSREVCLPMGRLADILPRHFIRIHRCFIVNRFYVSELRRYKMRLTNGTVLPVPEKRYRSVSEAIHIAFSST